MAHQPSKSAADRVVVVGGGPGGLTAAMLLAHRGFDVTLFEKEAEVGGRSGRISLGPYHFDIGSTLLLMRFVLDEMFELTGRKAGDYIDFVRIDPMYRLRFPDKAIELSSDPSRTFEAIAQTFPGNQQGYLRFLRREDARMDLAYRMLQKDYSSPRSLVDMNLLRALPRLGIHRNVWDVMGDYFDDDQLKIAFSFQTEYMGMSPWHCPGTFSIVPFAEHKWGIYHARGGINQVCRAMARVAEEEGAEINTSTPVRRLITRGRRIDAVELTDGSQVEADQFVIGADFAYAMSELVDDGVLSRHSRAALEKKKYSCSAFMLYIGLDKLYDDQPHHSFVFAEDYKRDLFRIAANKGVADDFSAYLCYPSISDPTMAPPGHSSLYVLVPVANAAAPVDWEEQRAPFTEKVLDFIERRTEMKDLRQHIERIHTVTPADWVGWLNVYRGAVFNLAHVFEQLTIFRPHNQFNELDNCYLAGGGTNPGSGLPTIFESGRITANAICRQYGLETRPAKPLPPASPPPGIELKRPDSIEPTRVTNSAPEDTTKDGDGGSSQSNPFAA